MWSIARDQAPSKRILVLHNAYREPGGEDGVVAAEVRLLCEAGHAVELLQEDSKRIHGLVKIRAAFSASYSVDAKARVAAAIRSFAPDVMHCHNLFPLFSTSVYDAAREAGVPVVQTLHNFRMKCANGLLMREGQICERCVGKTFPHSCVRLRCYQGSAIGSAAAAASITLNHLRQTYQQKVDIFVALSAFCRSKFLEFGLPADKVLIKPNFLDPSLETAVCVEEGRQAAAAAEREHFLFAGRVSPEKGLSTLLAAWKLLPEPRPLLKIVGDGREAEHLRVATTEGLPIEWLGRLPQQQVRSLMRRAAAVVVPSVWYEGFPLVAVEAFAAGTPVIASDIGSLSEIVGRDGAGLLVKPRDPADLARALRSFIEHPAEARACGLRARGAYEKRYTAAENLGLLEAIYQRACESAAARKSLPATFASPWTAPLPALASLQAQLPAPLPAPPAGPSRVGPGSP